MTPLEKVTRMAWQEWAESKKINDGYRIHPLEMRALEDDDLEWIKKWEHEKHVNGSENWVVYVLKYKL